MGHSCCGGSCRHEGKNSPASEENQEGCGCGHEHSAGGHQISHEDMEKLMKAIEEAGYKAAETPDGDIKISE